MCQGLCAIRIGITWDVCEDAFRLCGSRLDSLPLFGCGEINLIDNEGGGSVAWLKSYLIDGLLLVRVECKGNIGSFRRSINRSLTLTEISTILTGSAQALVLDNQVDVSRSRLILDNDIVPLRAIVVNHVRVVGSLSFFVNDGLTLCKSNTLPIPRTKGHGLTVGELGREVDDFLSACAHGDKCYGN